MADILEIPKRPKRNFLEEDFKATSWDVLKPHFESLMERKIDSVEDLKKWFLDRSEVESDANAAYGDAEAEFPVIGSLN